MRPCSIRLLIRYFLLSAILLFSSIGYAQRYIGVATSQWSAMNSLYLNPASIAGCREQFSIGIGSFDVAVDNNLGHLPAIPDINSTLNAHNNIFTRARNKNFSMIVPMANVRGPGIVAAVSPKISIAFTTGIRGFNQFSNFNPSLYKILSAPGLKADSTYSVRLKNFNWTAHMWSEIGLSIGAIVREGPRSSLSIGGTFRRLGGIGYIGLRGKNLDVTFNQGQNFFKADNTNVDFATNVLNDSSAAFKNISAGGLVNKFFGQTSGEGFSADLGFTVTIRIGEPEPSEYMESTHTHNIILSGAVTDWGGINYFKSTTAGAAISGSGQLSATQLAGSATNFDALITYARQQHFKIDTLEDRRVRLPVALVAGADVQIYGRLYANLLFIGNLANRLLIGNSYYSQITFTPRYDYHKMTISLPITFSYLSRESKLGFAFRYRGVYIGSDDMAAFYKKYQSGTGIYMGGFVPIYRTKHDPSGLHWR